MKGKRGGKRAPRRSTKPRRRVPRAPGMLRSDCAQVTVNYGEIPLASNQGYAAYSISLSNNARAKQVAQAYQFYRITRVHVKIKPYYDTFAATGATTLSVPNVYWMIDRSYQFASNTSVNTLKTAGAKPHRLDDKNVSFSFSPSVSNTSISAASPTQSPANTFQIEAGTYRISPWLPTNGNAFVSLGNAPWIASSVDHGGFAIGIEQANVTATTTPVCSVEFVVEFEFKKRLWESPPSDTRVKIINFDTMTLEDPPEAPPMALEAA